jgi:hypothetical protein
MRDWDSWTAIPDSGSKGGSGKLIRKALFIQGMTGFVDGAGQRIEGIIHVKACGHPGIESMAATERMDSDIDPATIEVEAKGGDYFTQEGVLGVDWESP